MRREGAVPAAGGTPPFHSIQIETRSSSSCTSTIWPGSMDSSSRRTSSRSRSLKRNFVFPLSVEPSIDVSMVACPAPLLARIFTATDTRLIGRFTRTVGVLDPLADTDLQPPSLLRVLRGRGNRAERQSQKADE